MRFIYKHYSAIFKKVFIYTQNTYFEVISLPSSLNKWGIIGTYIT